MYATWKELGLWALEQPEHVDPTVCLQVDIRQPSGGMMSQIIMVILLSIFNGEQGTLPDTFGVLLHGPSKEQLRSHFDFSIPVPGWCISKVFFWRQRRQRFKILPQVHWNSHCSSWRWCWGGCSQHLQAKVCIAADWWQVQYWAALTDYKGNGTHCQQTNLLFGHNLVGGLSVLKAFGHPNGWGAGWHQSQISCMTGCMVLHRGQCQYLSTCLWKQWHTLGSKACTPWKITCNCGSSQLLTRTAHMCLYKRE